MRTLLLVFAIALAVPCHAQSSNSVLNKSARGSFYVSIDDFTTIFLNGKQVLASGIGEHRSAETELKTGDRVLARMHNKGGPRRFMLLFASSDGKTVVSFRSRDWKVVPDIDVSDFDADRYQTWSKYSKQDHMKYLLPLKSYSDWVWGDLDKSILACIVSPQMFSQPPN